MSIESFFTTQMSPVQQGQAKGASVQTPAALSGMAFMDFMLQQWGEVLTKQGDKAQAPEHAKLLQSKNPLLNEEAGIDVVSTLADNPEVEQDVEAFSPGPLDDLPQTLALNQQAFDDLMVGESEVSLTVDVPEGEEPLPEIGSIFDLEDEETGRGFLSQVDVFVGKIRKILEDGGKPSFLTNNLSPEQVSDLQNILNELDSPDFNPDDFAALVQDFQTPGSGQGASEDMPPASLFAGMVSFYVPGKTGEKPENGSAVQTALPTHIAAANDVGVEAVHGQVPTQPGMPEDIAAKLSTLVVSGSEEAITHRPFGDAPVLHAEEFLSGRPETQIRDFGDTGGKPDIEIPDGKPVSGKPGADVANMPQVKPDSSALQSWPFGSDGSLLASMDWGDGFDHFGVNPQGLSVTGLEHSANLVTQARSAAYPHPATQMVAATIQKAGSAQENTNITLQLDPPELGRVEVRMSFGKDKSVKTSIISEKPETHMMMQRDSHLLERALQDSGLDVDSGSLSFDLAQDGYAFQHNGGHDHGRHAGGSSDPNSSENLEIIESTMTWQVDLETGHTHYSILA